MPDKSLSDLRKRSTEARRRAEQTRQASRRLRAELTEVKLALEQMLREKFGRPLTEQERRKFFGEIGT